ncbi:MAG: hypothetical protein WA317_11890 [Mycobacterium sp.]|uniref:hypothetical protein n=1 Tax=Mycobacterium sp. TaxID=1785 RepID=UPI003CC5CCF9
MRSMGTVASASLLAAMVTGGLGAAPSALGSDDGDPVNGTYIATSVGEWATTNESFHDEPTVHSTWTITTSCTTAQDCSGQVTSDQGWSAPLIKHDGTVWFLRRDVPNWESCPDGTAATGHQVIYFIPVGQDGMVQHGSSTLAGQDKTTGPSGACGANRWLVIAMPFRLDKLP